MRGTRTTTAAHRLSRRFIPAHAGNTRPAFFSTAPDTVHPRACGEHAVSIPHRTNRLGSSPRMRGTRVAISRRATGERFIPAHAGNTRYARSPFPCRAVHPRACGEHVAVSIWRVGPAVHPRACGEHASTCASGTSRYGSSPRMRGTRKPGGAAGERRRFIPAHAGNTLGGSSVSRSLTVHPRACGEHMHDLDIAA